MTDDRYSVIVKYAMIFGLLCGVAMVVLIHLQIRISNYAYLYVLAIMLCFLAVKRVLKKVSYKEVSLASLLIVLVATAILFIYFGVVVPW